MQKTLQNAALIISTLLHPLFMPILGVLFMYNSGTYASLLPYQAKRIILLVIAVNTCILPLLTIPLFVKLGLVKSLHMHHHRERIIPMGFTLIPYLFSVYFLGRLPIPGVITTFMLGAVALILISMVISIWWKISIHMLGIGGMMGFILSFTIRLHADALAFVIMVVLASGLLAWSRLQMGVHNPPQVYGGFAIGAFIMFLPFFLL